MNSLLRNDQRTQSGCVNMEQRWENEEPFHTVGLPLPLFSFFLSSLSSLPASFLPTFHPRFSLLLSSFFPYCISFPSPCLFLLIPSIFSSSSLISSSLPVSRRLSWEVVNHSYPPYTLAGTNQRILHTASSKFSQNNQWVYWTFLESMNGGTLQEHGWPQRSCPSSLRSTDDDFHGCIDGVPSGNSSQPIYTTSSLDPHSIRGTVSHKRLRAMARLSSEDRPSLSSSDGDSVNSPAPGGLLHAGTEELKMAAVWLAG